MVKAEEKLAVVEHQQDAAEVKSKPSEDGDATRNPRQAPRAAERPATQEQAQPTVRLDDSGAIACYANFCRVTGTPEEVILDLGLNPQPFGAASEPMKISQRLIINYYTAKRLLAALSMTVQRHEGAFGVLETDVQKRVRSAARGA